MDGSGSFEWEEVPDLTSFSEEELKAQLDAFSREEREVSYRRRVLQGRIDLLRVELVRRGELSVSANELARVLLDEPPEGGAIPENVAQGHSEQKREPDGGVG